MKEQLDLLRKLQLAENKGHGIEMSLQKTVGRLTAVDDELEAFGGRLDKTAALIEETEKCYRSLESDAGLIQSQIKNSEGKLRSVKTNKEYQSLLKEIEELKKRHSSLEDEMIQSLDAIESAQQEMNEAQEKYKALRAQVQTEKRQILKEKKEGEEAIEAIHADKERLCAVIDVKLMKTFELIRDTRGDRVAIARVRDAICLGCNVNIPPQLFNELQRGDSLKFCPNCQRIIYWWEEIE